MKEAFNIVDTERIIEMAWEDRTPFEAIAFQFNINQDQVIEIMRSNLKSASFKRWRKRTKGRVTKHQGLRINSLGRFKCSLQRTITGNKISKR